MKGSQNKASGLQTAIKDILRQHHLPVSPQLYNQITLAVQKHCYGDHPENSKPVILEDPMDERIKELGCLYDLSLLYKNKKLLLTEVLQQSVQLIQSAFQYADITHVRLAINDTTWVTPCFQEGELALGAIIPLKDSPAGKLEVFYTQTEYDGREVSFLKKEQALLDAVGISLGQYYDLKQSTEQTLQAQKRMEAILNSIGDGVIATDTTGRITGMNPIAEELTAWKENQAIGQPIDQVFRIVNAVTGKIAENPVSKVLKTGGVVGLANHTKLLGRDGKEYQISDSGAPIMDDNKSITGVVIVFRDVTNEYHQTEEIKRIKDLLDSTIRAIPDMLSIHDTDMNILYSNWKGLAAIAPKKRKLHTKCYKTYRGFSEICPDCHAIKVIESKKAVQKEVKLYDGSWVDLRIIPILDNKGECHMYVEWVRDITQKVHAENELIAAKNKYQTLADQLRERNIDLLKTHDKARESDRLKTAFLANMSHEIRTPMNGILGFSELIGDEELTLDERDEYNAIIRKSARRLMETVDNIINIAKIESGQMDVSLTRVDVKQLVEDLCAFFRQEAQAKGLNLSLSLEVNPAYANILTDREKLSSIITNLVTNAIKYTDHGEVALSCSVTGTHLIIQVTDTGVGISQEHHQSIFKAFSRVDLTNKEAKDGTGLGLSIIKSYIDQLGGTINLDSRIGEGSTFTVSLPVRKSGTPMPGGRVQEKKQQQAPLSIFKEFKILIVEDEDSASQYLERLLRGHTKALLFAGNGMEAVDVARSNMDIDIILMDIRLPIMNGYEATKTIRQFNQSACIIAQSAYAFPENMQKARDAGCDAYIAKPIQKDKLMNLINKTFQRRSKV